MPELGAFHLLRPQWLWALVPLLLVAVLLARQQSPMVRWRRVVAPHLLEHLVMRPRGGWRPRPIHFLVLLLAVGIVAAAGPTWRHERSPFTEDEAPLVLALDLSRSMLVEDVRPSRLERAKQKIRDLLAERKGARTALVVYAGTAHLVLPLTDDPQVMESFVGDLDPSIMPVEGKEPTAALAVAREVLADERTPGTLLFLTDGIDRAAASSFGESLQGSRDQIAVLALGTEAGGVAPGGREVFALDRAGLESLQEEAGALVVAVTVDDGDVRRLLRAIDVHLASVQAEDLEGRWRDEGWWLVWPVALLSLLWFRRGWVVAWEG